MNADKTRIRVDASFDRKALFVWFTKPVVEIDSEEHKSNWGVTYFDVEPGKHKIRVFYPYLYNWYSALDSMVVTVKKGQTIRLKYDGTQRMNKGNLVLDESDEFAI